MIVWITGRPGAGKTTYAKKLKETMFPNAVILDGDVCREWLTPDCDFSQEGRLKHAIRVWKVAYEISNAGGVALVAVVAHSPWPYRWGDITVLVEGPERKPLWEGTTYVPPENPDWIVRT